MIRKLEGISVPSWKKQRELRVKDGSVKDVEYKPVDPNKHSAKEVKVGNTSKVDHPKEVKLGAPEKNPFKMNEDINKNLIK